MKKLSVEKLVDTVHCLRKEKGLTQAQLAAATGINRAMIGRLENKRRRVAVTAQLRFLGCCRSGRVRGKNACHGLVDTANGLFHFLLMLPLPIQMRLKLGGVGICERKLLGRKCLADKPAVDGNGNRGWRKGFLHGVIKDICGIIHMLCQRVVPIPHILKADAMPPDFAARSVVHFQSAQGLPVWGDQIWLLQRMVTFHGTHGSQRWHPFSHILRSVLAKVVIRRKDFRLKFHNELLKGKQFFALEETIQILRKPRRTLPDTVVTPALELADPLAF